MWDAYPYRLPENLRGTHAEGKPMTQIPTLEPPDPWLTSAEVAAIFKISKATLSEWRAQRKGPRNHPKTYRSEQGRSMDNPGISIDLS